MPTCFVTGIQVPMEQAFLLDRSTALRAAKQLRERLSALEKLIAQLGPTDNVEVAGQSPNENKRKFRQRRLVSPAVAQALAGCYPESPLFYTWAAFVKQKPFQRKHTPAQSPEPSQSQAPAAFKAYP